MLEVTRRRGRSLGRGLANHDRDYRAVARRLLTSTRREHDPSHASHSDKLEDR